MKKAIFLIIFTIIFTANSYASNNTVGPFQSLEECSKTRDENNSKSGDYQNYERSKCYLKEGSYLYNICKKGEDCSIKKIEEKNNQNTKNNNFNDNNINNSQENNKEIEKNPIEKLKEKLKGTDYSLKYNEGSSSKNSYHIFYKGKMVGYIYQTEKGISMGSGWQGNGTEVSTFFDKKGLNSDDLIKFLPKIPNKKITDKKNNIEISNKNTITQNGKDNNIDKILDKKIINGKAETNQQQISRLQNTIQKLEKIKNDEKFKDNKKIQKQINDTIEKISNKINNLKKENNQNTKNNNFNDNINNSQENNDNSYVKKDNKKNIQTQELKQKQELKNKSEELKKQKINEKNKLLELEKKFRKAIQKFAKKRKKDGKLETNKEQINRLENTINKINKIASAKKYKNNEKIQFLVKVIVDELNKNIKKIKEEIE